MVLATMKNKMENSTTVLIEKDDIDKMQEDIKKLKSACVVLKHHLDKEEKQLSAVISWIQTMQMKYDEYDSNSFCRAAVAVKKFFQKVGEWFKLRFKSEDEEDDY